MTIGELIVLLGFRVEGAEEMEKVTKGLDRTAGVAGKVALGIDAVTAAMGYMIHTALDAASGFQKFELSTGLSSEKLQQWTYRAAMAKVSAEEMTQTIEGIQKAGIKAATTGEGIQPWRLLGIDPRQNPFVVLDQLDKALHSVDQRRVALAQAITEQAGIPRTVFAMLRRPDPGALPKRYILTEDEQQRLQALNSELSRLLDLAPRIGNIFSSELAPELTKVVIILEKLVDRAAKAIAWLEIHPRVVKGIADVAIGLTAVGTALSILAVGAKAAAVALPLLSSAFIPIAIAAGTLLLTLNAIVETYRLIQTLRSGNHETEDFIARNKGYVSPGLRGPEFGTTKEFDRFRDLPSFGHDWQTFLGRGGTQFGGGGSSVEFNNTFTIHESGNPNRTKGVVQDALKTQLQTAGLTAPAPNH